MSRSRTVELEKKWARLGDEIQLDQVLYTQGFSAQTM